MYDNNKSTNFYLAIVLAWLAIASTQLECAAANFTWQSMFGGFYNSPSNWNPNGVPGAADTAIFNIPGTYGAALQTSKSVSNLNIASDAGITMRIGGVANANLSYLVGSDINVDHARLTFESGIGAGRLHINVGNDVFVEGDPNNSNSGVFTLADDATMDSDNLYLGSNPDSFGRVNVTGALTHWNMFGQMAVGDVGGGSVSISDGASVSSSTATITRFGLGNVGSEVNSISVDGVGVDGLPSRWSTSSRATIGEAGEAMLSITGGAQVTNGQVQVARFGGSHGAVLVSGTDAAGNPSTWNTGALSASVFANGGQASLAEFDFLGGAQINSGAVGLGSSGGAEANVSGTDVNSNPTTWNIGGDLTVAGQSFGHLNINAGAQVNSVNTSIASTSGVEFGRIAMTGSSATQLSTWNNAGNVYVGGNASAQVGSGRVELNNFSRANIDGEVKIWSSGRVTLAGGFLAAESIDNSNGGTFSFQGGTLQVGTFEGDLVNPSGVIAPGPGTAVTNVIGTLRNLGDAITSIDLGGTDAGLNSDLITVSGKITLDGDLQLTRMIGYVPTPDQTITIIDAGSLGGAFDNVRSGQRLLTTDNIGSFIVNYGITSQFDPTQVVLSDFRINPTLPGDFDDDGVVDGNDFLTWQRSPGVGNLVHWEANNGTFPPALNAATAVPEPASAALLVLVGLFALQTNRRQR